MHMLLRRASLLLLLVPLLFSAPALAQIGEPCEVEIDRAEELYRDSEFAEAERILASCLDEALLSDVQAVRGYRILALSRLQLGDVAGARRAVLRVFARRPGYRADPVQDPPSYQALVETVRGQLDDPAFRQEAEQMLQQRATPPAPPSFVYRTGGRAFLRAHTGFNSYGGERGTAEGSPLSEFVSNAGFSIALAAGYNFTDRWAVMLAYDAGQYPTLTDQKVAPFPEINPETSSNWLHALSTSLLVRILPHQDVTPTFRSGPGLALARINDETRAAFSLDFGLGADVVMAPSVGFDFELGLRYTFPGDAIDLVDLSGGSDMLTLLRVGLTWHVGRL